MTSLVVTASSGTPARTWGGDLQTTNVGSPATGNARAHVGDLGDSEVGRARGRARGKGRTGEFPQSRRGSPGRWHRIAGPRPCLWEPSGAGHTSHRRNGRCECIHGEPGREEAERRGALGCLSDPPSAGTPVFAVRRRRPTPHSPASNRDAATQEPRCEHLRSYSRGHPCRFTGVANKSPGAFVLVVRLMPCQRRVLRRCSR